MTAIVPFKINVSDEAITDLRERLAMTRWPQQVAADWSHGQPVPFIRELAEQWAHFDWRAVETKLNALPAVLDRDRRADHPFPAHRGAVSPTPSR